MSAMNHPDRTSYTSKNAIDLSFPGRIPLWYEAKLLLVAWLVLPQFRGASFIYDKLVREQLRKHGVRLHDRHGHGPGAYHHEPHALNLKVCVCSLARAKRL
jgi:hypothetical protein